MRRAGSLIALLALLLVSGCAATRTPSTSSRAGSGGAVVISPASQLARRFAAAHRTPAGRIVRVSGPAVTMRALFSHSLPTAPTAKVQPAAAPWTPRGIASSAGAVVVELHNLDQAVIHHVKLPGGARVGEARDVMARLQRLITLAASTSAPDRAALVRVLEQYQGLASRLGLSGHPVRRIGRAELQRIDARWRAELRRLSLARLPGAHAHLPRRGGARRHHGSSHRVSHPKSLSARAVAADGSTGTISGTITDAVSASGLPNVCVYLYTSGGAYAGVGSCTGPDGSYAISGVAPGQYTIGVYDPAGTHPTTWYGNVTTQGTASSFSITAGTTTSASVSMGELTGIAGAVSDSVTGGTVANACIYATQTAGGSGAYATCLAPGSSTYAITGMAPGTYDVAFFDPAGVHPTVHISATVAAGRTTAGVNGEMSEISSVVGSVVGAGSGTPISNGCVMLYAPAGGYVPGSYRCTDAQGRFTIDGVQPGTYVVAYYDPAARFATTWWNGQPNQQSATQITVSANAITTLGSEAVTTFGSATGQVVNGDGSPAAGVCVYADDLSGKYTGVGGCSDQSGHYTLAGLASGQYKIAFYPPGTETPSPYWYLQASDEASATPITITGLGTTNLQTEKVGQVALNTANFGQRVTIGHGFVEASARQVVRTSNDIVYVVTADDSTNPASIHVWKGFPAGIPTSFTEMDAANHPTAYKLGSPDIRLDRQNVIQIAYNDETNNTLYYQTFNTATDKWGSRSQLATNAETGLADGSTLDRTGNVALILDNNDNPNIAYTTTGNSVVYLPSSGTSGAFASPQTVATGTLPIHPALAMDSAGNVDLTWADNTAPLGCSTCSTTSPNTSIMFAQRSPSGTWSTPETVATGANSNIYLDQSPNIVADSSNVPYVTYIDGSPDYMHVRHRTAPGTWADDSPTPTSYGGYGHDPSIYSQGKDIYLFPGHNGSVNFGYQYEAGGAGGTWSSFQLLDSTQNDGSPGIRWDPARENDSRVIDTIYFNEKSPTTLYYMAVAPGTAASQPPSSGGSQLLGNASLSSGHDGNPAGVAEAFATTATASGTLAKMSLYVTSGSKVDIGVYSDNSGHPGTLLSDATLSSLTANAWNQVPVPAAAITSGKTYWIAILSPNGSGSLGFLDQGSAGSSESDSFSSLTALPTTWSTGTVYTDGLLSAYGTS